MFEFGKILTITVETIAFIATRAIASVASIGVNAVGIITAVVFIQFAFIDIYW